MSADAKYIKLDLGTGNTYQEGDEIWIECNGNGIRVEGVKLNSSASTSGAVNAVSVPTIGNGMPMWVRYVTTASSPWKGQQSLYVLRYSSNSRIYGISVHRLIFSITYKANGGSGEDVEEDANLVADCPLSFTAPSGKAFAGWNTKSDGTGDSYAAGDAVEEDLTLYAQWGSAYSVTEGNHANGTITISTISNAEGATVTLTATPDTGYEFTSWEILKTDNSSDVTDAVSMSSTTEATATFTMPAYGVTVNATFGAARYTVTYNANVGTCATASEKQATAGAAVTLPTPTFEGCTFDGWYNDGTKIGDADDEYIPTADITLYAKWTDNTEGKLFSYIDGNYGDKFQAFDGTGWVTADGSNKDKTFTDATTGAQFVVGKGSWDKKTNAISALAKLVKGTSTMSIVIPAGYLATVNILYGAYGTGDDYKLTVGETDQAATVTKFDDGHTNAQVASDMRAITLNDQSGTLVLSVHGNKNIYIGRVAVVLTKATGTITASGWNTFSSSYPLDLSTITATNEVAAYYASAASGSSVTMSTTEATVRAEEGLMIKGTADDVFTIDVAASGTAISGNLLVGLPNGGTVAKDNNNYVFGWADAAPESPGFYLVNETEPELGAGKAYLHLPSGSSAPAVIRIVEAEDNATNLDNLDSTEKAQKFIENGRLLILRDGITYDALGRVIR